MARGPGAERAPTGYNDVARDHDNQIDSSLLKGEEAPQLEQAGWSHDFLLMQRSTPGRTCRIYRTDGGCIGRFLAATL